MSVLYTDETSIENVFYNYKFRDVVDDELGVESIGRKLKNCMSSPPMDTLESG